MGWVAISCILAIPALCLVSNRRESRYMARETRFRTLLPVAQCALAALFGGVGLWQRSVILSRPFFGGEPLWNSTARFHVWPWPYEFAVVSNVPRFLQVHSCCGPLLLHGPNCPSPCSTITSVRRASLVLDWFPVRSTPAHEPTGRLGSHPSSSL